MGQIASPGAGPQIYSLLFHWEIEGHARLQLTVASPTSKYREKDMHEPRDKTSQVRLNLLKLQPTRVL